MAARVWELVAGAAHDLVSDRRNLRHRGHLGATLHRAECRLHANLHRLYHQFADLRIGQPLLVGQLALLQLEHQFLLDLGLDGFRVGGLAGLLDGLDHLFLVGQVHQVHHEWCCRGLHARRRCLDSLGNGAQLLGAETAARGHILQRHEQAGALHIVRQVADPGLRIHLGMVEHHGAGRTDGIALDDDGLFLAAHVGDQHGHQQFTNLGARVLEVVDEVGQGNLGLLDLRLLLNAGCCGSGLALE